MKSGYEMATNILKRRDIYLRERKQKVFRVMTVSTSALMLIVVSLGIKQVNLGDGPSLISPTQDYIGTEVSTETNVPTTTVSGTDGEHQEDRIIFNLIKENPTSEDHAPRIDPEKMDEVLWGDNDLIAYFGEQISKIYIPQGMKSAKENSSVIVYRDKQTGQIVWDEVELLFFAENTANSIFPHMAVRASRLGLVIDVVYVWPEEIQYSQIKGVQVKLGKHISHEGVENHVAYVAVDGIEFEIVSTGIRESEFLEVVYSLIDSDRKN